jgi:acetyl-CoA decarbonylase/synthase complex subunit delta
VPASWGDIERRSLVWEELTALSLLHSGADIVVLRHPGVVERVKAAIDQLMA